MVRRVPRRGGTARPSRRARHAPTIDPRFARPGGTVPFADGYPLLLTTRSSLDALNSLIAQGDRPDEAPVSMNRFRPHVVIEGTVPWAEGDFRRLAIGEAVFRVAKPCGRCVVTTTDQVTAVRGKEPLPTLARHRRLGHQLVFGRHLVPRSPGHDPRRRHGPGAGPEGCSTRKRCTAGSAGPGDLRVPAQGAREYWPGGPASARPGAVLRLLHGTSARTPGHSPRRGEESDTGRHPVTAADVARSKGASSR